MIDICLDYLRGWAGIGRLGGFVRTGIEVEWAVTGSKGRHGCRRWIPSSGIGKATLHKVGGPDLHLFGLRRFCFGVWMRFGRLIIDTPIFPFTYPNPSLNRCTLRALESGHDETLYIRNGNK